MTFLSGRRGPALCAGLGGAGRRPELASGGNWSQGACRLPRGV